MNMLSKKVILPMAAVAVIGAGIFGASIASADSSDELNPRASLIQKLADKFGVDKSQVQTVFDDHHKEMKAEMQKRYEERLSQAVTDGELTSAQKDSVLAKHNELKTKLEELKDSELTREERREALEKLHAEAKDWAEQNNIDAKWLMPMGGHGPGHHLRGGAGPEA